MPAQLLSSGLISEILILTDQVIDLRFQRRHRHRNIFNVPHEIEMGRDLLGPRVGREFARDVAELGVEGFDKSRQLLLEIPPGLGND